MNIHENIIWRLAQVASLSYQERYLIGGSVDEYVTDYDILEDVNSIKYLLAKDDNYNLLGCDQIRALNDVFEHIECIMKMPEAKTREEGIVLIREGEAWTALRNRAAVALELFGVAIGCLTADEVAKLTDSL